MRIPPYCKASKHKYKDSSRRQKLPQIIFGSWRNFYGVRMGHFWNGAISGAIWQQSIWKYPTQNKYLSENFLVQKVWPYLAENESIWDVLPVDGNRSIWPKQLFQLLTGIPSRHHSHSQHPYVQKKTNLGYKFCILLGKQLTRHLKIHSGDKLKSFFPASHPGITATHSILMCTTHWRKVTPVWLKAKV